MEERQQNYTIMEGYELPSRGKIYEKSVNSHVELRAMTGRDEMKRRAMSTTQLKTLADIIDGCLIEKPGISVYDMALGDYEYLLHKLRIVSYGQNYKMELRCPSCGKIIDGAVDLETLEVREYDEDLINQYQVFEVPASKKRIAIKFETPRMIDNAELKAKDLKRKFKDSGLDFSMLAKLEEIIDTVDGVKLTEAELERLIMGMQVKDLLTILNRSEKLNSTLGLDKRVTVICPECEVDFDTYFHFGPEFFGPTDL